MKKIRKAIIPAAGLGTRFLPATKAIPKEMLPLVDKPTLQHIVEEAVASGIEDILLITGRNKSSIEDHFDRSPELEAHLIAKHKEEEFEAIKEVSNLVNMHYIRQTDPRGLGHAVLCARSFVGNEPFAVLLGDDIILSKTPVLAQMINQFESVQSSIIAAMEVPLSQIGSYGCIDPIKVKKDLWEIKGMVEKPDPKVAPSNIAIIGRYILTPTIFPLLAATKPGQGNEIQLTDAIEDLRQSEKIYGYRFEGERHDVGDKLGFLQAALTIALDRPDLAGPLKTWLKTLNLN